MLASKKAKGTYLYHTSPSKPVFVFGFGAYTATNGINNISNGVRYRGCMPSTSGAPTGVHDTYSSTRIANTIPEPNKKTSCFWARLSTALLAVRTPNKHSTKKVV